MTHEYQSCRCCPYREKSYDEIAAEINGDDINLLARSVEFSALKIGYCWPVRNAQGKSAMEGINP